MAWRKWADHCEWEDLEPLGELPQFVGNLFCANHDWIHLQRGCELDYRDYGLLANSIT